MSETHQTGGSEVVATHQYPATMVGNEQTMELVLTCFQTMDVGEEGSRAEATQETETKQATRSSFLLTGRIIHEGDQLALRIFDTWVEGVARRDRTGWYLLTTAQVGIRLSAGLPARWGETDAGAMEKKQREESSGAKAPGGR